MRHQLNGSGGLRASLASIGLGLVGSALVGLVPTMLPGPAAAQEGSERYRPARTRADYEAPYEAPVASEDGYDYAAQTLRVSIWLDRDQDEVYNRGDEQRVTFQTNEDAYAVVYRIDTDGMVTVLWPRDRLDDGFVFGGHEYRLPGREAPALRIRESEGEGYVQALASRYPFDLRALELDFLGEGGREDYGFRVAGDPFLAMNEVNHAITGLEDSRDHVISNHARYYVHRVVDHPRYLCSQCHADDVVRYDPYGSHCTLVIDYDYGWSNRWYVQYGYFPVYWNPVYVYVDPWTWRPWINFWYDPWYACAPWQGWRPYYWDCYSWNDSPYYHGNCWTRWDGGDRRFRPLNRHGDTVAVRKVREFDKVTRQVGRRPLADDERSAMIARRPLAGRGDGKGIGRERDGAVAPVAVARGDKPLTREVERFPGASAGGRGGGLRIRPEGGGGTAAVGAERPTRRHTAGGSERAPSLQPVKPVRRSAGEPVRGGSEGVRGAPPAREQDRDGVRALNPRQQDTRTWNRGGGRNDQGVDRPARGDRPTRVRPREETRDRGDTPADTPARTPRRDDGRRGDRGVESRRSPADNDAVRQPAPDRGGSGRREEGAVRRGESPRSVRETPPAAQPAPSAPPRQEAPARQETPRRSEPARGRDGGDNARDRSGDGGESRSGEAPARRSPNATRR